MLAENILSLNVLMQWLSKLELLYVSSTLGSFVYMLGRTPGGLGFEDAPFKLPEDYVRALGGVGSDAWGAFATALARRGALPSSPRCFQCSSMRSPASSS